MNNYKLQSSSVSESSTEEAFSIAHPAPSSTCCLLSVNKKMFAVKHKLPSAVDKTVTTKLSTRQSKSKRRLVKIQMYPPAPQVSVCITGTRYPLLRRVVQKLGWKCAREREPWNIYWTDSVFGVECCRNMRRFQKTNHFPGMIEICRKDLLARNLNRMLKAFPHDYQIFPKTWCLPADSAAALKFERAHRNCTYILKPDQGAQGRGIWLTKSLKEINLGERMICQLYINRPLLIDGFKFDLRIYALLTSIDPLRLYVYNEGLARFATRPYRKPTSDNTANMFMHLTNYSVNRHSQTFCKDEEAGSKRKFSTLNRILVSRGYDVIGLWHRIDDVIAKTILSGWPMLRHNYRVSFPQHDIGHACFEILGMDILIDETLRPWLLEVNHSPSFHANEPIDREVKESLITDTLLMLNVEQCDKRVVMVEDRRRVNMRLQRKLKEIHEMALGIQSGSEVASAKQERTPPEWWMDQVMWEETHMGGFRRVLPASEQDAHKYADFFVQPNSGSIYCDTVSSKRREKAAAEQRAMLAERVRYPPPVVNSKSASLIKVSASKEIRKISNKSRLRKLRQQFCVDKGYHMTMISDAEERQRLSDMTQREYLLESCDVLGSVRNQFYHHNLMTPSDRVQYELEHGIDKGNSRYEEVKMQLELIHRF